MAQILPSPPPPKSGIAFPLTPKSPSPPHPNISTSPPGTHQTRILPRSKSKQRFQLFDVDLNSSDGPAQVPRSGNNALLTTPVPPPRLRRRASSEASKDNTSTSVPAVFIAAQTLGVLEDVSDPALRPKAIAGLPKGVQPIVAAALASSSGNSSTANLGAPASPQPRSPRSLNRVTGGLRLDLGSIKTTVSIAPPAVQSVDVVPALPASQSTSSPLLYKRGSLTSPKPGLAGAGTTLRDVGKGHVRSQSHIIIATPRTPYLRKKSGELVKPSLKSSSSFVSSRHDKNGSGHLSINTGLPNVAFRSEPTTPTGPKSVHFDAKLEHVKLFRGEQKPTAVSRDGSPTETSEGGADDYFAMYGGNRSSDDERIRNALEMQVINMPVYYGPPRQGSTPSSTEDRNAYRAVEALSEPSAWQKAKHVQVESFALTNDARSIRGTVIVRNLAFGKWIAARFTLDGWSTTSEVTAKHVTSLADGAYDRFEFFIKLDDIMARIWDKTLEIAVRFTCEGHGEMWDNNAGKNYKVTFKRKRIKIIQPAEEDSESDEDVPVPSMRSLTLNASGKGDKGVAALKKSLETAISHPPRHLQSAAGPIRGIPATGGNGPASPSLAFVNNRSAADVLSRVGKSSATVNSPSPNKAASAENAFFSNAAGPLSPRKPIREGTLTARYDLGSSLKNAHLSPTVPFPRSSSPSRSPQPQAHNYQQSFVSTPISFGHLRGSLPRGSPRDAATLTPGREVPPSVSGAGGLSTPFRTSSDSDLPTSFRSVALKQSPFPPVAEYAPYEHHPLSQYQNAHAIPAGGRGGGGEYFSFGDVERWNGDASLTSPPKSPLTKVPSAFRAGEGSFMGMGGAGLSPMRAESFPPVASSPSLRDISGFNWNGSPGASSTSSSSLTPVGQSSAVRSPSPSRAGTDPNAAPRGRPSVLEDRRENPSFTAALVAPSVESPSTSNSTLSTPSATSNSSESSASSSPSNSILGSPIHTVDRKHDGGVDAEELALPPNRISSFLDQFCFYTGPDGGLDSRRSYSTSDVADLFMREPTIESGRTTPTASPFLRSDRGLATPMGSKTPIAAEASLD